MRCVDDALIQGEITPIVHTIGVMLATYSGHDGHHVFPSHRRLADDVGRSRSTVRRALKQLRELSDAGIGVEIIAARLRRSVSAVRNKAGMHGFPISGVRRLRPVP